MIIKYFLLILFSIFVIEASSEINITASNPTAISRNYTFKYNSYNNPIELEGKTYTGILTFQLDSISPGPYNGSLCGPIPHYVYTPRKDYVGTDSIRFRVSDGTHNSSYAKIEIKIENPSDKEPSRVQQTGQTHEYTRYDDGYFEYGESKQFIPQIQIIEDKNANLMWLDIVQVQTEQNHQLAVRYCENQQYSHYDDWRLPTIKELMTLIDYSQYSPAIHRSFQYVHNFYYTSSTTVTGRKGYYWGIFSRDGTLRQIPLSQPIYIKCVRNN